MIQFFHATYIHLDIQPKAPELFNCCILSPELVLWMFPPLYPFFFSLPKTTCFVGNLCIYVFLRSFLEHFKVTILMI